MVAKSLAASIASTTGVKTVGRFVAKLAWLSVICVLALAAGVFFVFIVLFMLSMLGTWVLALVALIAGSEITPQNTLPLFVAIKSDATIPLTHRDAVNGVIMSVVIDCLLALMLSVLAVSHYNKTRPAGFIRLSWERFKVWKDGTVVCPLIEFEETN
ncbi:hypothetical protein A3F64_02785 [Candidatus Saccharibacteria bacterium RIFCSPHIGHO2_12_FULL_42_8]|nr:MAG: hypothetical protein A3F64_02785 [Candidatus Saccharibacteria bacterium RIFCSPHIGHO2_12_FULL_42_8]